MWICSQSLGIKFKPDQNFSSNLEYKPRLNVVVKILTLGEV
jgi:hypothetical protein